MSHPLCHGLVQCCPVPNYLLGAEVTVRHFGTSADTSGQFGTGAEVSSAEMSWVRSVLGPKCLDTPSAIPYMPSG